MNRHQRRAHRRLFEAAPSGQFVGELQKRAEQAAYTEQLRTQMQEEDNGAPIPPEIAARMTKPKVEEPLHQVVVTKRAGGMLAVGPMMIKPVAEEFAVAINAMVAKGLEKTWSSATVVQVTSLQGAH